MPPRHQRKTLAGGKLGALTMRQHVCIRVPAIVLPAATVVLLFCIGRTFAGEGKAGDWPQWRGPNRDGVMHGVTDPAKWPKALKEEWKVTVGEGISSPVVAGGRVYVFTRQQDNELVYCLDVATGKDIWRSEPYPAPRVRGPGAGAMTYGPRSTPAVADGRVFTLGVAGVLSCLDAKNGQLLWRNDSEGYPAHGACTSPLVADGLCIVQVGSRDKGGLTAFDVKSGEVKWCLKTNSWEDPAYGSPILVDLAGERQVVTFTGGGSANLIGVSPATGKRLWRLQGLRGEGACLTPVQYKDLLIFADYQGPPWAIRLEKGDKGITAKDVWKAKGLSLYYSSPVLAGDWLFGLSTQKFGQLYCLDAKTGQTLWQSEGRYGGDGGGLAMCRS
jgi:outer membrane protein assembly factor BamB